MNNEKLLFHIHKALIKGYARTLLQYDLFLEEPLPPGPKILVANHPSTSDPFMLPLLVKKPVQILITEMAFEVPVFGRLLQGAGHIRVGKVNPKGSEIIHRTVERLLDGDTVAIFPEGSLSPAIGQFWPARTGAVRVALLSGAPVIPIGIHLSQDALAQQQLNTTRFDSNARWAVRGAYYTTVGRAMYFHGDVEDRARVRRLSERIMEAIILQSEKSSRRMQAAHVSRYPLLGKFIRRFLTQT